MHPQPHLARVALGDLELLVRGGGVAAPMAEVCRPRGMAAMPRLRIFTIVEIDEYWLRFPSDNRRLRAYGIVEIIFAIVEIPDFWIRYYRNFYNSALRRGIGVTDTTVHASNSKKSTGEGANTILLDTDL